MSTAMEQEQPRSDANAGRLLRFTVRMAAAAAVITGLLAWAVVSHAPGPSTAAPAQTSAGASTGLFYHASNQMSYRRGADGLYRIDTDINERRIRFVLDTGTAAVVLSREDARAAGFGASDLNFSARAATPNGEMRVAPVIIPMMTLNQLTLFNVKAVVAEGALPTSVLGMGFLTRFDSYDMHEGELILRW
jgi:clan AA aspartic protease (TIGR02281 family)